MTRQGQPDAMESLYPFLYEGASDLPAVLEEVRRSTVAKAREITELRRLVSARDSARLMSCARDAAARFAGGGRLLAFGNGGSATDAQELATLYLNPGGDAWPLPALGLASDASVVTALCNDIGVEVVFARQIAAFGRRGDIAVGLSTSGNSENLLRAFDPTSPPSPRLVASEYTNGRKPTPWTIPSTRTAVLMRWLTLPVWQRQAPGDTWPAWMNRNAVSRALRGARTR